MVPHVQQIWKAKRGSGDDLVLSGNEPVPMLSKISDANQHHKVSIS